VALWLPTAFGGASPDLWNFTLLTAHPAPPVGHHSGPFIMHIISPPGPAKKKPCPRPLPPQRVTPLFTLPIRSPPWAGRLVYSGDFFRRVASWTINPPAPQETLGLRPRAQLLGNPHYFPNVLPGISFGSVLAVSSFVWCFLLLPMRAPFLPPLLFAALLKKGLRAHGVRALACRSSRQPRTF